MATILYGIPNCDTVRKARAWLSEAGVAYQFHDFRKQGIDAATLARFQEALGWETVLNRRGTTWRGLSEEERTAVSDASSAARLMALQVSLIKRPVLEVEGQVVHAGFSPDAYANIFTKPGSTSTV